MNYTIEKIENGLATFRYADNSYAEVALSAEMTEAEVDDLAFQFAPKAGTAPSHAVVGQTRTAAKMADDVQEVGDQPIAENSDEPFPEYLQNRVDAYGSPVSQIEYITENGLEAWQAHVAEIKAQYPAPSE